MQGDLFPEMLKQIYRSDNCFDISLPLFDMPHIENPKQSQRNLIARIKYLKNLPVGRFFIFANRDGLPYIYDKDKKKKLRCTDTRRVYSTVVIETKPMYIHTLAAMFFLENDMPDVKTQVDHLNNDKYDYRLSNLQWVSAGENMRRAMERRKI
tara:strand:- start:4099 stop:4557 length:459 start_codon:yes stop_codon:yes gene_type:complete